MHNASLMIAGTATLPCPGRAVDSRFFKRHVLWPLLGVLLLMMLLLPLGGDFWLADRIYAWEGHRWALQQHPLTLSLIHEAGREASRILWFLVALLFLVCLMVPRWRSGGKPLGFLLLATLIPVTVVSVLKHTTHMDCPWDLTHYGGLRPFVGLFSPRPVWLPDSRCFPAGHASAGYAWVALYFFLLAVRPSLRMWGLGAGLAMGLIFGFSQQLRGAHFLSHDVATLAICWAVSLSMYRVLLAPGRIPQSTSRIATAPLRSCQEKAA